MTFRDRLAIHLGPLPLRLVFGLTFIWVGLGKINARQEVSGQDAADLAFLGALDGVVAPPPPPAKAEPSPTSPVVTPPVAPPTEPPTPLQPLPEKEKPSGNGGPASKSGKPTAMLDLHPAHESAHEPLILLAAMQSVGGKGQDGGITAADFPKDKPLLARRLHTSIGLTVYRAAHPPMGPDGKAPRSFWFQKLGSGSWPVYLAWTVALTELIGGVMILFGLGTRLASVILCGVMLGALWLTQLGPAWASGNATMGILPAHDAYDVRMWMPMAWQLALLGGLAALVLTGAGSLSLDRWLASSPSDMDEEIDE